MPLHMFATSACECCECHGFSNDRVDVMCFLNLLIVACVFPKGVGVGVLLLLLPALSFTTQRHNGPNTNVQPVLACRLSPVTSAPQTFAAGLFLTRAARSWPCRLTSNDILLKGHSIRHTVAKPSAHTTDAHQTMSVSHERLAREHGHRLSEIDERNSYQLCFKGVSRICQTF